MTLTALQRAVNDQDCQELILRVLEAEVAAHHVTPMLEQDVDTNIAKAADIERELIEIHRKILNTSPADDVKAQHEATFVTLSTKINRARSTLHNIKAQFPKPSSSTPASTVRHSTKLPEIPLPSFDGKYEEWPAFEDVFKAAIDKKSIPACEKLQYLKTCLKGEASQLQLVKAFTTTDANYIESWKLVSERYQNNREIIFSLVDKLVSQQQVKSDSTSSLQSLLNTTMECIQSLKVMGRPTDTWDDIIVVIIMKKLDPDTRSEWARTFKSTDPITFKQLQQFLEVHIRTLHAKGIVSSKCSTSNKGNTNNSAKNQANSHHVTTISSCRVCNGREHNQLYLCPQFVEMKPEDRASAVRKVGNCLNCLREGHIIKYCTSKSTCKKCGKRHHTMLHNNSREPQQGKSTSNQSSLPSSSNSSSSQGTSSQAIGSFTSSVQSSRVAQVLLKTAVVDVIDAAGNKQPCRVLLDDGSEASFITEACATSLGLKRERTNFIITGISAKESAHVKSKVNVRIHSQINDSYIEVETLILHKVTGTIPRHSCDTSTWTHLQDLRLADPHFCEPGEVDILLGADVVASVLRDGRKQGSRNTPTAMNSIFGWVLSGRVSIAQPTIIHSNHASCKLEEIMQKFWECEDIPASQPLTIEENACEQHFTTTHRRLANGRFEVRLPFNSQIKNVGETRQQAAQRLLQLERRFKKFPHLKSEYVKFIREYEELGHMEPATYSTAISNPIIYLPHHFVVKEDSRTTRLRVVFDGSMRSSTGVSLNNALMVGATIQDDLYSLLLRFRLHPIALKADIAKMYRQFNVNKEDADCQRILWREDPSENIREYRLTTVTYGTASAPFLATRCLSQLAKDEEQRYPTASNVLQRDTYVDDLMSGTETTSHAIQLVQDLNSITKSGQLEFRKWCTNDAAVLQSIPENLRETNPELDFDRDETVKALGVRWHPINDVFRFQVNIPRVAKTKRELLSDLARVFDPVGWLTPATVTAKLILQRLWKEKIDWDEPLTSAISEEWSKYQQQLPCIMKIRIPRCIITTHIKEQELHGFADSSECAFSSALYLKTVTTNGEVHVHLLTSKTKVAPLKQVSLPRLELCGAKLLVDTIDSVKSATKLKCPVYAWTDSTIVLRWISSSSRRWKTYVANRVSHIQAIVPPENWRHVKSEDNPADLPSRGIPPSDLVDNNLWWHGPPWLQSNVYPLPHAQADMDKVKEEERTVRKIISLQLSLEAHILERISNHFSSWHTLCVSTAYWIKFISWLGSNKRDVSPLRPCNMKIAQQKLLRWIQRHEFQSDYESLTKHSSVRNSSKIKQLSPWIDQHGLLRVGGRLQNTTLETNRKHPIILPGDHPITRLLISDMHKSACHAGFTLTHSLLRRQYWILRGRSTIKNIIRKCVTCRRIKASTATQLMGNLPSSRVTPSRPFSNCGVDFAGPFLVKMKTGRGQRPEKCYFSIFVCFSTKAIHLEPVTSLSTEAFIACYRRFVARRGISAHIYSDCGTNFVGADKELQQLLNKENSQVQQQLTRIGSTWHFNPPAAPHQNGICESGVKQVKYHFRRVVGAATLSFEQFQTLLCNIEACLNSRPLCALSCDPTDLEALTPGHFLTGDALLSVPDPDVTHVPQNRLGYWKLVQQLNQHFWKRWSNEYLGSLQQRYKWTKKTENLTVGDLVIIRDETLPPTKWKLGRIIKTHPGTDGLVRCVTLRTANGEMSRPITKLAPLIYQNETM